MGNQITRVAQDADRNGIDLQIGEWIVVDEGGPSEAWYMGDGKTLGGIVVPVRATPTGAATFLLLSDTPASFAGQANQYLRVNAGETGIEFAAGVGGTTTYLGLTDSPGAFGVAGAFVRVNSSVDGLEHVSASVHDLSDTPGAFGTSGQILAVNMGGTGLEYVDPVTVDLGTTISDETGSNAGPAPLSPPPSPDTGDIHIENYDDATVWWVYDGATWNVGFSLAGVVNTNWFTSDLTLLTSRTHNLNSQTLQVQQGGTNSLALSPVGSLLGFGDNRIFANSGGLQLFFGAGADFIVDGSTGTAGQALLSNGANNAPGWGAVSKATIFADDTSVSPARPGDPTEAEILVFAGAARDVLVWYNGTDVATSNSSTHAWYIDLTGTCTRIEKPLEDVLPAADEGQLVYHNGTEWVVSQQPNLLTGETRQAPVWTPTTGPGDSGELDWEDVLDVDLSADPAQGANATPYAAGTILIADSDGNSFNPLPMGAEGTGLVVTDLGAPGLLPQWQVIEGNTTTRRPGGLQSNAPTEANATDLIGVPFVPPGEKRHSILVEETDENAVTTSRYISVPNTANLALVTTGDAGATAGSFTFSTVALANDRRHLTSTEVAAASIASPTIGEIQAAVTAGGYVDELAYYTGTDTPGDAETHVYWVDGSGTATLIQSTGGASLPSVADDTVLVGDAGDPTGFTGVSRLYDDNGSQTLALGTSAGAALTADQQRNTLIGFNAGSGLSQLIADDNTVLGAYALDATDSGYQNVVIGTEAASNLTGATHQNVVIGRQALRLGGAGVNRNVVIGMQAGYTASVGDSTLIGYQAAYNLSTGVGTTAIGYTAGYNLSTGANNTAIGYRALYSATTAANATAVGTRAGESLLTGSITAFGYEAGMRATGGSNTFIGTQSGYNASTGSSNTGVGQTALYSVGAGIANTAMGRSAGRLVDGNYNTAIGAYSLEVATGSSNTAVGYQVGNDISTGSNNTLVGYQSGDILTSGTWNVSLGAGTLRGVTTGGNNVAIGGNALQNYESGNATAVGYNALGNLVSGAANTAIGYSCGRDLTTGGQNVLVGHSAGQLLTTSGSNVAIGQAALALGTGAGNCVAIGRNAAQTTNSAGVVAVGYEALKNSDGQPTLVAVGYQAGLDVTSGGGLTLIGYQAGNNLTTGSQSVAIGNSALNSATSSTRNVAIGASAYANGNSNDTVAIGFGALNALGSGANNIAIGSYALNDLTSSNQADNTVIGTRAMEVATAGAENTVIGSSAGNQATTGNGHVLVGFRAGYAQTSATNNVMIGRRAGETNETSGGLVCIGYYAGRHMDGRTNSTAVGYAALASASGATGGDSSTAIGANTLANLNGGTANTALGWDAGNSVTTGASNTLLGAGAGSSLTSEDEVTIIGRHTGSGVGSNDIVLSDGAGTARAHWDASYGTWIFSSLPTSAGIMPTGALYNDGGTLKIV